MTGNKDPSGWRDFINGLNQIDKLGEEDDIDALIKMYNLPRDEDTEHLVRLTLEFAKEFSEYKFISPVKEYMQCLLHNVGINAFYQRSNINDVMWACFLIGLAFISASEEIWGGEDDEGI
jgi:hypothetical protein